MAKEIPENVKGYLRAVLISKQGGVLQTRIERDYKEMTKDMLNWRQLGFQSLYEFLLAVPDVGSLAYSEKDGENKMFGKASKETFQSLHAKKAQNIPDGCQPHRPPSQWARNKSSPKGKSTGKASCPNPQPSSDGLYSLCVSNIPSKVGEREMRSIFGKYDSLKVINIIRDSSGGGRNAFIKYSKKEQCLRALNEMNGFTLYGTKLSIVLSNGDLKTQKHRVLYRRPIDDYPVEEEDGLYPIHVSNFPPATLKKELQQIFIDQGFTPVKISMSSKFAFLYFETRDIAVGAIGSNCQMKGKALTITPKTKSAHQKKVQDKKPGSRMVNQSGSPEARDIATASNSHEDQTCARNSPAGERSTMETSDVSCTLRNMDPAHKTSTCLHIMLSAEEMEQLAQKFSPRGCMFDITSEEYFDVLVTEVVDSCTFWANIDDKTDSFQQLNALGLELQRFQSTPPKVTPIKHAVGVARFSEDGKWYRCLCLDVSREQQTVKVFYLDFGNCEWVPWQQFGPLHERFWKLPPQAVPCKLSGLEPKKDSTGDAEKRGSEVLRELVCYKYCKARKCPQQLGARSHMLEVELRLNGNLVNSYMLTTELVNKKVTIRPLMQPDAHKIDIRITWVDQNEIFYQEVSQRTAQIIRVVRSLLGIYNVHGPLFPGEGALAVRWGVDGSKRRVQIKTIHNSAVGINKVVVRDIDDGTLQTVPLSSLSAISPELRRIAPLACRAKLHMLGPQLKHGVRALLLYKRRASEVLKAEVVHVLPDGVPVLVITDAEGNINERLLNLSSLRANGQNLSRTSLSSIGSADSHSSAGAEASEDWNLEAADHGGAETKREPRLDTSEHYMPPVPPRMGSPGSHAGVLSKRPMAVQDQSRPKPEVTSPQRVEAAGVSGYREAPAPKASSAATQSSHGSLVPKVSQVSPVPKISQNAPVGNVTQEPPVQKAPHGSSVVIVTQPSPLGKVGHGLSEVKVSQVSPVPQVRCEVSSQEARVPSAAQGHDASASQFSSGHGGSETARAEFPTPRSPQRTLGAGGVDAPASRQAAPPPLQTATPSPGSARTENSQKSEGPPQEANVPSRLLELEELSKRLEEEKRLKEMETRVLRLQKELRDLDSTKAQLLEDLDKR